MLTRTNPVRPELHDELEQLNDLKQFKSHGRGFWYKVSDTDWNDWRWQLKHRITTVKQLAQLLPELAPEENVDALLTEQRLAMSITPYFFTLIDPLDLNCPIRRQVVPRIQETQIAPWETPDPCAEELHSPVPGLVHRYPDRVLLLLTDRCASYCRYCTRARLVSHGPKHNFLPRLEQQLDYIRRTKTVRDVLISGGDPLLVSDDKLASLLDQLRAIKHVELIRLGTRVPIFLPQRVTDQLCSLLRRYQPLFVSIHSNHPRELTCEARDALWRMADAGVPLGNQSVLLKGVNDNTVVLKAHMQKLLMCRVKPYYLYQCDLVPGTSHFRVSVRKGLELMSALRGHTSGYAIPTYVIDAPGGGGKVPIDPAYVISHSNTQIVFRNYEGKLFEYPETSDEIQIAAHQLERAFVPQQV